MLMSVLKYHVSWYLNLLHVFTTNLGVKFARAEKAASYCVGVSLHWLFDMIWTDELMVNLLIRWFPIRKLVKNGVNKNAPSLDLSCNTKVGNFPGRALSFAVRKGGEPRVISFPSKSVSWRLKMSRTYAETEVACNVNTGLNNPQNWTATFCKRPGFLYSSKFLP